jgi:glucose-6-phosphate 1-dehydrogenase
MKLFVIFGATGDVVSKKVLPSLFHLFLQKELEDVSILAVSRRDFTDGRYGEIVRESIASITGLEYTEDQVSEFVRKIRYEIVELSDDQHYKDLTSLLSSEFQQVQKIVYLGISSQFYTTFCEKSAKNLLNNEINTLIIEKPVGNDYESALVLQQLFTETFGSNTIFLLDHYLGKNMVRAIPQVKKQHSSTWNRENIASIEVVTLETLDVANRGEFYDSFGTLRDVGQNHTLQLLALSLADEITSKIELLNKLPQLKLSSSVQLNRAQYDSYTKTEGVKEHSKTETYFNISFPWLHGLKVTLTAGKKWKENKKYIKIQLHNNDEILIDLVAQKITHNNQMLFSLDSKSTHYISDYANEFLSAIKGEKEYFVTFGEVLAGWKFVDCIEAVWNEDDSTLLTYNQL